MLRLAGFTRIDDEKLAAVEAQIPTARDAVDAAARAQYAREQARWPWENIRATLLRPLPRILITITILSFATFPVLLWLHVRIAVGAFPRWMNYSLLRARLLAIATQILAILWAIFILLSAAHVIYDQQLWRNLRRVRAWIGIPLCGLLVLAVATSPRHIIFLAKKTAALHQCGGAWMTVEIMNDTATMWLDGEPMYSYRASMPHSEIAIFSQINYRSGALGIPTLRRLEYNITSGGIIGSCLAGLGSAENVVLAGNTTGCLDVTGNYATTPFVEFNMTVAGRQHSQSRAVDPVWSFDDGPFLDLRDAARQDVVFLQTSLHFCPKMTVCVPGPPHPTLGPEVLAPLGWLTLQANHWSARCTERLAWSFLGPITYIW